MKFNNNVIAVLKKISKTQHGLKKRIKVIQPGIGEPDSSPAMIEQRKMTGHFNNVSD